MNENSKWRSIAEKASIEMDGNKLAHLIGELCRAIDEEHNEHSQNIARKHPQTED
ncbi:MAG: hypothetical protein ABSE92_04355 [Terriglobales bacterium]|jgi:hypothetical protein